MKTRPLLASALAATFIPLAGLRAQEPAPSGPIEVNAFAATVNGQVITKNQVAFMLAPEFARLTAQFPRRGPEFERQFNEAKENILQELIDRQIILDEFKQMGATIRPHLIDEEVKNQIRTLYNGDETKFREELKRSRLTMEGYREMTREKMVVQAMRAKQFADAPPPLPHEIQAEYNEIKPMLRDTTKDVISFKKIFVPRVDFQDPSSTEEGQLSLAEEIAAKIRQGGNFEELAKAHSADAFADVGGIQTDVPRTDLSPEFAAILFDAKDGQLANNGPIEDPAGYTLVIPTSRKLGPSPPLSQVREMVENRVRSKKTSAQYERWIESRRKRAMIDRRD